MFLNFPVSGYFISRVHLPFHPPQANIAAYATLILQPLAEFGVRGFSYMQTFCVRTLLPSF